MVPLFLFLIFLASGVSSYSLYGNRFQYSRQVTIVGSALTSWNSEVLIVADTSLMISEGKLASDCRDLIFVTDDEMETELAFFLESGCGTSRTQYWVELDEEVGVGENVTVKMKYYYENIIGYVGTGEKFMDAEEEEGKYMFFRDRECSDGWYFWADGVDRFIVPSLQTDGGIGNTDTHLHYSGVLYTGYPDYNTADDRETGESSGGSTSSYSIHYSHNHAFSFYTESTSHLPLHYALPMCYAVGTFDSVLDDSIAIFDGDNLNIDTLPDWDRYSSLDNKFVKVYPTKQSNQGSDTHVHYVESDRVDSRDTSSRIYCTYEDRDFYAKYYHDHEFGSTNSQSSSNVPTHRFAVFGKANKDTVPIAGMIIGASHLPPMGWEEFNSLNDRLIRGEDYFSTTVYGTDYHSHLYTQTTLMYDGMIDDCKAGGYNFADYRHTHDINVWLYYENHHPPWIHLKLIKRKTSLQTVVHEETRGFYFCYNVPNDYDEVCNHNGGVCVSDDVCNCTSGYLGVQCEENIGECNLNNEEGIDCLYQTKVGVVQNQNLASDEGFDCSVIFQNLDEYGVSTCEWEYSGVYTSKVKLSFENGSAESLGFQENDLLVLQPMTVIGNDTEVHVYLGERPLTDLEIFTYYYLWMTIVVPILIFLTICAFVFGIVYLVWKNSKQKADIKVFEDLDDVHILVKEQKARKDKSKAHLKLKKNLFEIKYKEVELLKEVGTGGSGATIYKAKWKGNIVAFKVFKTNNVGTFNFDEFESEVVFMTSLHHPNILAFYGACVNPPRVGIVMEFCENGDLTGYIQIHEVKFNEKIRIMSEVAGALDFLHSRKIVHRDLKSDNVLLDGQAQAKVIDFGTSKIQDESKMTKCLGTSYYMAPEVVLGKKYSFKVDVFSFGIMMFEVVTKNFNPYSHLGESVDQIEYKVANNPDLRPKIEGKFFAKIKWYTTLMKKCWQHDPHNRPSMTEIKNQFQMELKSDGINIFEPLMRNKNELNEKMEKIKKDLNDLQINHKDIVGQIKEKDREIRDIEKKMGKATMGRHLLKKTHSALPKMQTTKRNKPILRPVTQNSRFSGKKSSPVAPQKRPASTVIPQMSKPLNLRKNMMLSHRDKIRALRNKNSPNARPPFVPNMKPTIGRLSSTKRVPPTIPKKQF